MRILVIGQAPPAVKQQVPYDTTLFYEMLSWISISKEGAQIIFEFEAMTDKFPGHGVSGHKPPSQADMDSYFHRVLQNKLAQFNKVLVLGSVAKKYLTEIGVEQTFPAKYLYLMHPSRRNYSKIMADRDLIRRQLFDFILK